MDIEFIQQPNRPVRLGEFLKRNLSERWTHFRAAVAFAKRSGTRHIAQELTRFSTDSIAEIIVGIDHGGTSSEALIDLVTAVKPRGRIVVFHNRVPSTFHPKLYLFKSTESAEVAIGSGNLTEGGLYTNYEAAIRMSLDLNLPEHIGVLRAIEDTLDTWADTSRGTARVLNDESIVDLTSLGLVGSEGTTSTEAGWSSPPEFVDDQLFESEPVLYAPRVERSPGLIHEESAYPGTPPAPTASHFFMTLQQTDVGTGQTTAGTSRRSPEIFIPLSARNAVPDFWDWPGGFSEDPARPGKLDRKGVRVRLGSAIVPINMMTWPVKHDFRLRNEALRSAGSIGDILHLQKTDTRPDFEYIAEVIPQGTSRHVLFLPLCKQSVPNSQKRYGYY